jgi:predicted enzyme related to lactoylglutathione lyase
MIKGIDIVFIHVKNPKLMAEWYKKALNLDIASQTDDLHWQEFEFASDIDKTRFALDFPGEEPNGPTQQSIMISFKVDDIGPTVEQLEKKGVIFIGDPKIVDVGPSFFATFIDPEGNYIQLSQKKVF